MLPAASSPAVFTTLSRFYDVLLESKGAFYSARRRRARRSNKADRTMETRGYPGVKRKKNNRSPISRSVPETCSKIPADIKNFCGRKKKITTRIRDEITLQTDSEKLEISAPVTYTVSKKRISIVASNFTTLRWWEITTAKTLFLD